MDKFTEEKLYLFHQGTYYRAYEFMGCQYRNGVADFRVWSPNAAAVSVVGDFNDWQTDAAPMQRMGNGVWVVRIDGLAVGQKYKYFITTADGATLYKSDPYGFEHECYGDKASRVCDISQLGFDDGEYMQARVKAIEKPLNIYEAHIGSWRRDSEGNVYSYRRFADEIVPYLCQMSFTHLELVGIAEYPFDPSWGYQVTGYFAPTSRYGSPQDFAYLVNKCHKAGIGVILDWVPGHFPKDANGLYRFDGAPCYEDANPMRGEHKEWGTCCFDYGRTEVQSFLVSNAMFWADRYHIDGLRVDAVASMLYLDYGRREGEWSPNSYGGKENLEAIAFLRKVNDAVHGSFPDCMMIAEESTAWPMVTYPPDDGGLGFDYKWNMGWMNDSLAYVREDPIARQYHHNKLTFAMMYAFSENFIMPISHDEVVYGKGSLLNKMHGDISQKFHQLRLYLMNMYAHPGKKLLFMGCEFGQFDEWNYAKGLDFFLVDQFETHRGVRDFAQKLFALYLNTPALYEQEKSWEGFHWLVVDDNANNVLAYERRDIKGNRVLVVLNFSPVFHKGYKFGIERGSFARVLMTSAEGWNTDTAKLRAVASPSHGKPYSVTLDIPSFGGMIFFAPAPTPKTTRKKTSPRQNQRKASNRKEMKTQ